MLAKETNTPVLFTPAELPLEVTEEVKTVDAPVVGDVADLGASHGDQAHGRRSAARRSSYRTSRDSRKLRRRFRPRPAICRCLDSSA